jgi:calcium-dependent protein kinase
MHKNGIVHRNLRPETILFESETCLSDIKLVDLISAIEYKNITEDDNPYDVLMNGSPFYRCPELLMYKKVYDAKCDVWSSGTILYNLVTGIPPFFEDNDEATKEKIKTGIFSC